jgi:hypothetical protein
MSDIEDVQNLVNSVPREGLANVLDAVSEQRRGRDRTWIVRGVLALYVVSIAVSIGYQIIRGDEDASAGISETHQDRGYPNVHARDRLLFRDGKKLTFASRCWHGPARSPR